MKYIFIIVLICFFTIQTYCQLPYDGFVRKYSKLAQRLYYVDRVPAAIRLVIPLLESSGGKSILADSAHNLYSIKAWPGKWHGEIFIKWDTDNYYTFRKYNNFIHSIEDFGCFLHQNPRYQALFSIDPCDYRAWLQGLVDAGYCQNPSYVKIGCELIEAYGLMNYNIKP